MRISLATRSLSKRSSRLKLRYAASSVPGGTAIRISIEASRVARSRILKWRRLCYAARARPHRGGTYVRATETACGRAAQGQPAQLPATGAGHGGDNTDL